VISLLASLYCRSQAKGAKKDTLAVIEYTAGTEATNAGAPTAAPQHAAVRDSSQEQ
jgi:hypothetical protein